MEKRALIAMSGGVDSSVAAYLMKKEGYDCIGVTMKLHTGDEVETKCEKSCCSLDDVNDARNVASCLDIPFYVLNFKDRFEEKVIDKFTNTYMCGGTPNPCIDCNRYLKFNKLMDKMREFGFDYVVTGHYAMVQYDEDSKRYILKKGLDETKDQSYVLYSLTQEQLAHIRFPLGEFKKTQIRQIADDNGFINAKKHDSQDICFVPDGDYAQFIKRHTGKDFAEGDFVDMNGKVLGRHKGIIHYTIGQRKGLGLSLAKPMYVVKLDTKENKVVLGEHEDLFCKHLDANDINLISVERIDKPMRVKAKIRYRQVEQWATVIQTGDDSIHVEFDEPQRAITKGQAVVLYNGNVVVGGGTII